MTAWKTLAATLAKNPISTFAVMCVMATGAFLGYTTLRLLDTVSSFDWCAKAVQAERITPGQTFLGLTSCVDLLKMQVGGMVNALLISLGSYSFTLIVLIVVVVAGAKATGKVGAAGVEFDVGKQDVAAAADHVVDGAKEAAAEVKQ